jgi:hypothetical protein
MKEFLWSLVAFLRGLVLQETWVSWGIFFFVVVVPWLRGEDEWVSVLRLLTFIAGCFAGGLPGAMRRER